MGRPYDHQYHYAGSGCIAAGVMECVGCHKPIDSKTQDWLSYKKSKNYDWGYVNWHRECRADPQWDVLDRRRAKSKADYKAMCADVRALAEKWSRHGWSLSLHMEEAERDVRDSRLLGAVA